jgi:hypothetical protein
VIAAAGTSGVAIAVTVIATLVVVALLAAVVSLLKAARALRDAAEELARQSADLVRHVDGTVAHAAAELARVDDLIGSAQSITQTVGATSRLVTVTLSSPIIKALAFGRGTARASRRLRRGAERGQTR